MSMHLCITKMCFRLNEETRKMERELLFWNIPVGVFQSMCTPACAISSSALAKKHYIAAKKCYDRKRLQGIVDYGIIEYERGRRPAKATFLGTLYADSPEIKALLYIKPSSYAK